MVKKLTISSIGILSLLYLLNPTAGIFELIPDNIPLVGNVDEVLATTLLISSLSYFGIDIKNLFKREKVEDRR